MRSVRLILVSAAVAAVVAAPHASAGDVAAPAPAPIDEPEDCLELTPDQHSAYGITDDGQEIVLDAHFVLDEVLLESGQAIVAHAAKPYREIGIRLQPTFQEVQFPASGTSSEGKSYIDSQALIDQTRDLLGGYRPHNSDVVYTITSKEIGGGVAGEAVAGQADCIGGVRYPEAAFGVGEMGREDTPEWHMWGGKVAGHEMAHLLGAHHHYANCAQGDPDTFTTQGTTCTLMFNDVTFVSLRFSTVEAAVVRGHALEYLAATPIGPPPRVERAIDVRRSKRGLKGAFQPASSEQCVSTAPLEVQRAEGRTWTTVDRLNADYYGEFKVELTERGEYRVVAPTVDRHDGKSWSTCEEAVSGTVRV